MPDDIANPSNISYQLGRILTARNNIRTKLNSMNLGASTDNISTLASIINDIPNQGNITANVNVGESYTIPRGYHTGSGTVTGTQGSGQFLLQTPDPVTPTKSQQNVTPDNGYYGLAAVTIKPIPEAYQDVTSVTAEPSQVLATKIYVNSTGSIITGLMPNNGAVSQTISIASPTYTVPTGYHNGSGKVSISPEEKTVTPAATSQNITPTNGKVLSKVVVNAIPSPYYDVSGVTATAAQVLTGSSFVTSNGTLTTGTMANRGAVSQTLSTTTTQYTVPQGYHNGSGTVKVVTETKSATPSTSAQTISATAGKVLSSVSVAAIPNQYKNTTGADAVASQVLTGKKFVNTTGTVTGTMPNNGSTNASIYFSVPSGASGYTKAFTIPSGYHNGTGVVQAQYQIKTVTPTTSNQTIRADQQADGQVPFLSSVIVNAIPSNYKDTTGANAGRADVLSGKIFVNENGTYTGSMPNHGAVSKTLDVTSNNQSYTIPAGYHNGSGTVNLVTETKTATPSTSSQTITPTSGKVLSQVTVNAIPAPYYNTSGVTAVASHVLTGEVFVDSGGTAVTGTMAARGSGGRTLYIDSTTAQQSIFSGFYDGTGKISVAYTTRTVTPTKAKQNIVGDGVSPSNIPYLAAVTVNAIPAAYQDVTGVTAAASQVLAGTSYVTSNGTLTSGTMTDRGAVSQTLSTTSTQYTVPQGYHNGSGTVKIVTEDKTLTPTAAAQTVYATTGKVINKVTVNSIPGNYCDLTGDTAQPLHILSGFTAHSVVVDPFTHIATYGQITGEMPNNGAVGHTLDVEHTSYSVPYGFTNGGKIKLIIEQKTATPSTSSQTITPTDGKVLSQVTVNPIPGNYADVSHDDAVAGNLLSGKTAHTYINNEPVQITGTMTDNGAVSKTLDATTNNQSYTVPAGYHNGSGTVNITLEEKNLTPAVGAQVITPTSGKVISKVIVQPIPAKYGDTTGDDAVAANVLSGKKAHTIVNGTATQITGTMTNNSSYVNSVDGLTVASQLIPQGYHNGTGYIYLTNDIEMALASI